MKKLTDLKLGHEKYADHSTADLFDTIADVLTALHKRGQVMVPADGRVNGDLADIQWIDREGQWGTCYHTAGAAEAALRDHGVVDNA